MDTFRENFKAIYLPSVGLLFTVVFGIVESLNRHATQKLSESNNRLAESNVKVSLLPFLNSPDPGQRKMALLLADALDPVFAADAASILSKNDPNQTVRFSARSTLEVLLSSPEKEIRELAKKSLDQTDIMNELRRENLLQSLQDAQNYIDGGGPDRFDKALELYQTVIERLSKESVDNLNQKLLTEAEKNYQKNNKELAATAYRQLFADFNH